MIRGIAKRPAVWTTGLRWPLVAAVFVLVLDAGVWLAGLRSGIVWPSFAVDYVTYHDAAFRWVAGGSFYHPYQLDGPYEVWGHAGVEDPILYPPLALWFMVPGTALAPLWWIVPLGIIGWVVWTNRTPDRLALVGALMLWPQSVSAVWTGNPGMWVAAILALATRWPGFAPFVLVKPSLFPFALYRINRVEWWVGFMVLIVMMFPLGLVWLDYWKVLDNARQDQGLFYSVYQAPLMLVPLAAAGWARRV